MVVVGERAGAPGERVRRPALPARHARPGGRDVAPGTIGAGRARAALGAPVGAGVGARHTRAYRCIRAGRAVRGARGALARARGAEATGGARLAARVVGRAVARAAELVLARGARRALHAEARGPAAARGRVLPGVARRARGGGGGAREPAHARARGGRVGLLAQAAPHAGEAGGRGGRASRAVVSDGARVLHVASRAIESLCAWCRHA